MEEFRKLYNIFVDESFEHLSEIEKGLLELEKNPGDKELINTVFRAAHTIKGSSASIGLHNISAFMHNVEEVLDLMRQDRIMPERELINVFFESADLVKEMLISISSDNPFDFSRCKVISGRINTIKKKCMERQYKIIFIPERTIFKRGIDPAHIISDLKEIGEVISIKAYTDEVPVISEINPEELFLRWDIMLKTERTVAEIGKVFEFVKEGSDIKIFPVTAPDNEPFLGQMLIDTGAIKPEDVDEALNLQKRIGDILIEQEKAGIGDVEKAAEKQKLRKIELFKNSLTSTIKVDIKKLDHLINIAGEMIIMHSMLEQAMLDNGNGISDRMGPVFSQLHRIGRDIQESAMSLRMLPVGEVFHRFGRLVRELSASQGKKVELVIAGEDTEFDKGVLGEITDPLIHLIRNAVDHGIEKPDERLAKGKTDYGTIHLTAYHLGDFVHIEVGDDGRGLDREKITEKAVSKGLISSSKGLTDEQVYNLIFQPGFSTADKVTDVSGRGVGMDVVRKNIESLNGRVNIHTKPAAGTTISIKLPLTLAIIDGLAVCIGGEVYVVPVTSVIESLRPRREDVKTLNEKSEVINVRGEFIPLIRLNQELGITSYREDPSGAIVILVSHENKKCCLLADELMGKQQVVIKNLGTALPRVKFVSGGTILGNGKVALVLDVPGIIEHSVL